MCYAQHTARYISHATLGLRRSMSSNLIINLESWNPSYSQKIIESEQSKLESAIHSIESEASASIVITNARNHTDDGLIEGPPTFIVSASRGKYAVSAILDEDKSYDLVGDPLATGWINFTIGGQEASYPQKYLVSIELAIEVAIDYMNMGSYSIKKHIWDSVENPDSAWNQEIN